MTTEEHKHHCPNHNKMYSCLYKECLGIQVLICMACEDKLDLALEKKKVPLYKTGPRAERRCRHYSYKSEDYHQCPINDFSCYCCNQCRCSYQEGV